LRTGQMRLREATVERQRHCAVIDSLCQVFMLQCTDSVLPPRAKIEDCKVPEAPSPRCRDSVQQIARQAPDCRKSRAARRAYCRRPETFGNPAALENAVKVRHRGMPANVTNKSWLRSERAVVSSTPICELSSRSSKKWEVDPHNRWTASGESPVFFTQCAFSSRYSCCNRQQRHYHKQVA